MALSPERPLEESLARTGLRRLVGQGREPPAQAETAEAYERCEPALPAPQRWGLSAEAVAHLGRPSLPVLAALSWWCYDPYTRHQRARLRLSACPVDHGHRTARCPHGPHAERGRWASLRALHVPLPLGGTRGGQPEAGRAQGHPGLGPREHAEAGGERGRERRNAQRGCLPTVYWPARPGRCVPGRPLPDLCQRRAVGHGGLRRQRPQEGRALAQPPQTGWEQREGRPTDRGRLLADGAGRRVWPVAAGQRPRAAWWVRRRHSAGDGS
jgi:hypothetical protein